MGGGVGGGVGGGEGGGVGCNSVKKDNKSEQEKRYVKR